MLDQETDAAIRQAVSELLKKSGLDGRERADLRALCGALSTPDIDNDDMMFMYLSDDRDWRADFEKMYGRKPGGKPGPKRRGVPRRRSSSRPK